MSGNPLTAHEIENGLVNVEAQKRRCDSQNIIILDCLQHYRVSFTADLISGTIDAGPELTSLLASNASEMIAQFFYRLRELHVESPEDIREVALQHNQELERLARSETGSLRSRLRPARIERAFFRADVMQRLIQNWRERRGAIDQSNLARFLALQMSTETTRKTAVALSQAGCLERVPTPYGTTLIISTGKLEDILGRSIRCLADCIMKCS